MTLDILGNTPEAVKTLVVKASIDSVSGKKLVMEQPVAFFDNSLCLWSVFEIKFRYIRYVHKILHEMAQFMYFLVLFFSLVSV